MVERDLTNKIMAYLKTIEKNHDGIFIKIAGSASQRGGVSDIIGCYRGYFVAIEVKRDSDTYDTTKRQKAYLERVNRSGGYGITAESLNDVSCLFSNILLINNLL